MNLTPEQHAHRRGDTIDRLAKPPAGYTTTVTPGTGPMTGWDLVEIHHDTTGHEVLGCWMDLVGNPQASSYHVRRAVEQIMNVPH